MSDADARFIAVEGPIGVGKTTLCKRLSMSLGGELLLEDPSENPFLDRFYADPAAHALATQLFFLFQRARQLQGLSNRLRAEDQGELFPRTQIADYLLAKDPLFAELNLKPEELELYHQVFDNMTFAVPQPDLVIYLQAPADVLIHRISTRGVAAEQRISRGYLERLNDAYARYFHDYSKTPLLIVNAAEIDLVRSDQDYHALLDWIKRRPAGRNYINPMPEKSASLFQS